MSALRILVVGSGGREHALAWKLAASPSVKMVYIAPGNGGTASSEKMQNVAIGTEDFKSLVEFAVKNDVNIRLYVFTSLLISYKRVDRIGRAWTRTTTRGRHRIAFQKRYSTLFTRFQSI